MAVRLSLAAIGDALGDLPGPAKYVGAAVTVIPVLWALFGIGWSGIKTPSKLDDHIKQMEQTRVELKASTAAQASRDTALLNEAREGNRLQRCNLTYTSELARARCAALGDPR